MMPIMTRLLIKLKIPKKITIRPAVLKKIPVLALLRILKELKLNRASTGKVPRANESIINDPVQKLPVDNAYICIDCVKPQGKKKVTIPTSNGVKVWFKFFTSCTRLPIKLGKVGCNFFAQEKMSNKFRPRMRRIIATTKLMIKVPVPLNWKLEPIRPITPPSKKNEAKRPIWNRICGRTFSPP